MVDERRPLADDPCSLRLTTITNDFFEMVLPFPLAYRACIQAVLISLDMLHDLVVPARRNRRSDDSMAMLGLNPRDFAQFDSGRSLHVDELTLLGTYRFHPELLRPVCEALQRARHA